MVELRVVGDEQHLRFRKPKPCTVELGLPTTLEPTQGTELEDGHRPAPNLRSDDSETPPPVQKGDESRSRLV